MFSTIIVSSIIAIITATSDSSYGYGNDNGGNSYGSKGNSYGSDSYESYKPKPYNFGYDTKDHYGTTLTRQETSDGYGLVKGSYSYSTAHGISRIVEYEADHNGFRAKVKTNEPGTQRSYPAHVELLGPEKAWAEERVGYNNYGSNQGSSYSSNYGSNYGSNEVSNYGSSSYGSNQNQQYDSDSKESNGLISKPISYNSDYNYASTQQKVQSVVLPKQSIQSNGKIAVVQID